MDFLLGLIIGIVATYAYYQHKANESIEKENNNVDYLDNLKNDSKENN